MGLRPKKCGEGAGWGGLRGGCGLEVCGCGQNFSNSCGCGAGVNFVGAGRARTQNFNPRRTSLSTLSIRYIKSEKLRQTNCIEFLDNFVVKKAGQNLFNCLPCYVQLYLIR